MDQKHKKTSDDSDPRDRILACAKSEFAQHGFEGARMADIAKKAQVNKALIHYYFKSKESLYFEVIKRIFGEDESIFDIPVYTGNLELSPSQKLYIYIYHMVNLHLRAGDQDVIRIFFWEIASGEKYIDYFMEKYTVPRHTKLLGIIKDGIAEGEFKTPSPELAVISFFSFINFYTVDAKLSGGMRYFSIESVKDIRELVDFISTSTFKSLWPMDRPFELPRVPRDLIDYVDRILEIADSSTGGGVYAQISFHMDRLLGLV